MIRGDKAEDFVNLLIEQKDENGESIVELAGLGARNTLRIEAGLCLYGQDLLETITPIEALLGWTISKRRREEGGFPGFDIISKQIKEGASKKRVGFMLEGPPARGGEQIFNDKGENIGLVTSGTYSPSLKKAIGMAYVDSKYTKVLIKK